MPGERDSSPPSSRPALVLGGGGALGVVQAAYIEAAFELEFRPSLVIGTSVGAMNGAWVALNPGRIDELLRIWLSLDRLSLVKLRPSQLAARFLHPLSVTTNDIVPELVHRHMADARFSDTKLELGIVSTNLTLGEKHVFREGRLDRAIMASTAIPGVFEPVRINGHLFVDGCVTASVDMASAVEMGATEIFAIDLTPAPSLARPRTAAGVLKQSFSILTSATTRAVESCLANQMPVRVVRPDLSKSSPWRLDDSAGAIARNLRLAREDLHGVFDEAGHVAAAGTCWADSPSIAPVPGPPSADRYFGHNGRKRAS